MNEMTYKAYDWLVTEGLIRTQQLTAAAAADCCSHIESGGGGHVQLMSMSA